MADTNTQHFVRQRRRDLGLSQGDLALRLSARGAQLSRKAISEWERGKRRVQVDDHLLDALADALRWDIEQVKRAIT
ncbi:MAG: helix-turn-helix domain-containing protein [Anaerolineae bacterium]|nr:helix-turn-helix domain-containing protein [Anaerolineae bacterium]